MLLRTMEPNACVSMGTCYQLTELTAQSVPCRSSAPTTVVFVQPIPLISAEYVVPARLVQPIKMECAGVVLVRITSAVVANHAQETPSTTVQDARVLLARSPSTDTVLFAQSIHITMEPTVPAIRASL